MRKNTLNLIIGAALLLVLLGLAITGLILEFVLPPGSGRRGQAFWGLGRHDVGDAHFCLALVFLLLVFTHVAFHWHWVRIIVRSIRTSHGAHLKERKSNPQAETGCVVQQAVKGETFLGKQEGREKGTLC